MRLPRQTARAALFLLTLLPICALTNDNPPLNVYVRSSVDRPFVGLLGKEPARDHGRRYALVSLQNTPGPLKLVRPVSEGRLAKLLRGELTKRGFTEIKRGEEPEILLTVHYGRGWLKNPFLDDVMMNEYTDPPTATVNGAFPTHLMRQKGFNYEERTQAANAEKLFIRVTAWKLPEPPPAPPPGKKAKRVKPYLYWKTTMVADDPDNVDLNGIMEKLLAAGSAYFDKEIESEQVEIKQDMPEGAVILGELKVIPDSEPKTKPERK